MKSMILKRKWLSGRACDCNAEGPKLEPRTLLSLFDQNLRTCISCERIRQKIEDCVITLAGASVNSQANYDLTKEIKKIT